MILNQRLIIKLLLIAIIALTAIAVTIGIGHAVIYRDKIYPGVRINDLDVGGLTVAQATAKAKATFTPSGEIDLVFKEKKWPLDLDEIGVRPRAADSAKLAFAVGRDGGLGANLAARRRAWALGEAVPVKWDIDSKKTAAALEKTALAISQPPVDAKLLISANDVTIQPHQEGRKLLFKKTLNRLKSRIDNKTKAVNLAVGVDRPAKTTEDIKAMRVEKKIAEFSTSLSTARSGRRYNIELAMKKLEDTYVAPGATFSFNKIVGPRTKQAGFAEAPVIEAGQLVEGIGGGICQVATTIYNAAMVAGLPITERSVHSNFISSYPAGRDATVVDGFIDFKFKNDMDGTLVIKTLVTSNAVVFRIYGPDTGRVNTFSDPEITNITGYSSKTETDTALPPGAQIKDQVGIDGRLVKVVRKVTLNGKVIINETIVSRYTPRQEVIKVGPAPPEPEPGAESSAAPQANVDKPDKPGAARN